MLRVAGTISNAVTGSTHRFLRGSSCAEFASDGGIESRQRRSQAPGDSPRRNGARRPDSYALIPDALINPLAAIVTTIVTDVPSVVPSIGAGVVTDRRPVAPGEQNQRK